MRNFCLEVERRIAEFCVCEGGVMFGGCLTCDVDPSLAIPDNLGCLPPGGCITDGAVTGMINICIHQNPPICLLKVNQIIFVISLV